MRAAETVLYRSFLRGALAASAVVLLAVGAWTYLRPEPTLKAPAKLDVPYVATLADMVQRMLDIADVRAGDHVIDLGCGDGRIIVAAARDRGATGYGVDLDPRRIREAEANARRANVTDKTEFEVGDLFETPIADATVVTLYLLPEINLKLRPRLLSELRPGTRVVSHDFDMGDWTPDQRSDVGGAPVYLWIIPAPVAGRWTVTAPSGATETVELTQRYQKVTGRTAGGAALRDLRLSGDNLAFKVTVDGIERELRGRVIGDSVELADGWLMVRAR
jgi:SAM-dependent methyltransferase